ncbi:MAG: Fe-S cluster assembly protein SufD [Bacteroidales bacterium]|jgi:Fe-S cluster assembly protein SufD|nr:Fe-S cluster assembly protein SufD [Bacteroidales bacterium]
MQNLDTYIHSLSEKNIAPEVLATYNSLDIPNKKMEDWKFRDTQDWFQGAYNFSPASILTSRDVKDSIADISYDALLVFENGLYKSDFSQPQHIQLEDRKKSSETDFVNKLEVANEICAQDGARIHVSNSESSQHILIASFYSGADTYAFQKNTVYIESGSQLTITEIHISLSNSVRVNHALTIHTEEHSSCEYTTVHSLHNDAQFIQHVRIQQEAESKATYATFPVSGKYIRSWVQVDKVGEQAHTHLNGLFFPILKEHCEQYIFVNHLSPSCETHKLYKGLANDSGFGVFSGKVYVARDAQQTNAVQTNKNILLSDTAKIHSKPQLEIYADDVSCSHGSTTGQIDKDALWYMQSRGIAYAEAIQLLLSGFINDVVQTVSIESVRERIRTAIVHKL